MSALGSERAVPKGPLIVGTSVVSDVIMTCCCMSNSRLRDPEADAVRGEGHSPYPLGQSLGVAGGRGLSANRLPATEGHPPALEDSAVLQPEVRLLTCTDLICMKHKLCARGGDRAGYFGTLRTFKC